MHRSVSVANPPETRAADDREAECLRIWSNTINVLDGLYRVLLQEAGRVRADPAVGLKPLKELLDATRPQTEEARQLALFVRMLANFRRGEFISYAFKIKKACLLLLLGPRGAVTSLNLEEVVDARLEDDGSYCLSRLDPRAQHPRDAPEARRNPGREKARGSRPDRAPKKGGRPAMDGAQYLQLLAQLDAGPRAPPAGEHFPALKAARADRGAARGPPARAAYSDIATGSPEKLRSWDEIEPPRSGESWYEMSASGAPGDLSDDPYEPEEVCLDAAEGAPAPDAAEGAPAPDAAEGVPAGEKTAPSGVSNPSG